MTIKQFIDKNFKEKSLDIIEQVSSILDEYAEQGLDLSLRQLFYQMVSKNWLPNTQREYKNLGSLVADARLAGLLDWDMIKDRGRDTHFQPHWDSPADILSIAARQYREDKWARQPMHVEVMVEKQALEGVLIPICQRMDVRFTANKGYASVSLKYDVGQRLAEKISEGKEIIIIYLGDHDPSGMDMTRDVLDSLRMFSGSISKVSVERIALNMDQIDMWNPPPNTAKQTDSRHSEYVKEFGKDCWELDAVKPTELVRLVENEVLNYRDEDLWDEAVEQETANRNILIKYAKDYEKRKK